MRPLVLLVLVALPFGAAHAAGRDKVAVRRQRLKQDAKVARANATEKANAAYLALHPPATASHALAGVQAARSNALHIENTPTGEHYPHTTGGPGAPPVQLWHSPTLGAKPRVTNAPLSAFVP